MTSVPSSPGVPSIRRIRRALLHSAISLAAATSCWSSGITDEQGGTGEVTISVAMRLRGTHTNLGPIDAHVFVYAGASPMDRRAATVSGGQACSFGEATSKSCSFTVPRGSIVTLLATEGRPNIVTTVRPEQPGDTTHTGQFVEFAHWVSCPTQVALGACVLSASADQSVSVEYDLMVEIVVYQVGTARMDYLIASPRPALRIPSEPVNPLHGNGCQLIETNPFDLIGCTPLIKAGSTPVRRFTAFVSRGSSVAMRTLPGEATELKEWTPDCAFHFYSNGCGIVINSQPDSTAEVVRFTLWYDYWQCSTGPEEHDIAGLNCTLVRP